MKHFVIVYVSTVQSHFWRIWKLVFNVLFVAPCTRANIFVTEKLSQKICSCGCGLICTNFDIWVVVIKIFTCFYPSKNRIRPVLLYFCFCID